MWNKKEICFVLGFWVYTRAGLDLQINFGSNVEEQKPTHLCTSSPLVCNRETSDPDTEVNTNLLGLNSSAH